MNYELSNIASEIRKKLNLFYKKGGDYSVYTDDNSILIKGFSPVLAGTYDYFVPAESKLSLDEAKKFLETLNNVIIINNNLKEGESNISFRVTEINHLVFALDGKVLDSGDIANIYRKMENKKENDPLSLALNMIEVQRLYEEYLDLYDQVKAKCKFLNGFNQQISTLSNRGEAIKYAKENKGTWLKVHSYVPRQEFDILSGEDLIDVVMSHGNPSFSYSTVPLEDKKQYLYNLENYEVRIANFLERLKAEVEKLTRIDKEATRIMKEISEQNVLTVKPIEGVPEFDVSDLDTILKEEKKKYDSYVTTKRYASSESHIETVDEKYPWLSSVDSQQKESLNRNDKVAVMLYKSFMYHLFNQVVSYMRDNDLSYDDIMDDPYVEKLMQEEYEKYAERTKNSKPSFPIVNTVRTVVDDIFPKNYVVPYERFREVALTNLKLIEPALSKVTLQEPLSVYRCVHVPKGKSIYDGDLGNAFLSTSTDVSVVSDFIDLRGNDIEQDSQKVIYKINLPAGSPVIAFTNDIFFRDGSRTAGFGEEQREILIDSSQFIFSYIDADVNKLKDGSFLYSVKLEAVPKQEKEKSLA